MDVRLPDGTIITNVPEGTTQSELMRRVGLMAEQPKEKGFLSNIGSLIYEGGERAIGAAKIAPSVVTGNVGEDKAKLLAQELARPDSVRPSELVEAQRAFKEEAAAFDKAKGFRESVGPVADMLVEFGKQAITNPKGAAYLAAQSAANMAPQIAGMIAGGKGGALLGSAAGPGGAAIGAGVGAIGGGFAAGAPLEIGSEFIGRIGDSLRERGLEPTEANVAALLRDPQAMEKAVSEARTKGVTTASIDSLMTVGAGRFATGTRRAAIDAARKELGEAADVAKIAARADDILKSRTTGQKLQSAAGRGAGALGIDVAGGGISEAAGQAAAYGKVNLEDVGQEMLGSLGGAALEVPAAAYATATDALKRPAAEAPAAPPAPQAPITPRPVARPIVPPEATAPPAAPVAEPAPAPEEPLVSAAPVEPAAPAAQAPKAAEWSNDYTENLPPEAGTFFQNRDRSAPASVGQMQSIAANPDYSRLSVNRDFGSGAPVVISDLPISDDQFGKVAYATASDGTRIPVRYAVVEGNDITPSNTSDGTKNPEYGDLSVMAIRPIAGNGRVAGLRAAYSQGTAENYKRELLEDTEHGINSNIISGFENPVLVRVMPKSQVTPNIADISNISGTLRLSPVESAKNDISRVDLNGLTFNDDGSPNTNTLIQFVRSMPKDEQGELVDAKGMPNTKAIDRLNNAIFYKAYGSDTLIELYAQAADPEAKAVLNALAKAAPKMAALDGAGDYDVRGSVLDAAEMAVNASRAGKKLKDYAQQGVLGADPYALKVLDMFSENSRSSKRMAEALDRLATQAGEQAGKSGSDMFGDVPKMPKDDLYKSLLLEPEAGPDLFAPPPAAPTEPQAAAPAAPTTPAPAKPKAAAPVQPKAPEPAAPTEPTYDKTDKPEFTIDKPLEEIAKEVNGMTIPQMAQWTVDNAPNEAARAIAQKVTDRINEFAKRKIFPEKVKVLNGGSRWTSGVRGRAETFWAEGKGMLVKIRLNGLVDGKADGQTGTRYLTILHELVHAATSAQMYLAPNSKAVNDLKVLYKKVDERIKKDRAAGKSNYAITKIDRGANIMKNPNELMAWGLTDSEFQKFLADIKIADKTGFSKLIEIVRQVLGLSKDYESALDNLVRTSEIIMGMSPSDVELDMKPSKVPLKGVLVKSGRIMLPEGAGRALDAAKAPPTDSAAFKRWFGDSKVVDENGEPLVVYHGTFVQPMRDGQMLGDIEAFDRMITTRFRRPSIDTVGSWFSTNPGEGGAGMYAGSGDGSVIYPVYLSIKNPQVTTFQLMTSRARKLHNGKDDGRRIGAEEVEAYRAWLKSMGKDGIKIEGSGNAGSTEFDNQVAWIALEPTQIKSATGNIGTFSPLSSNITEERQGKSTPTEAGREALATLDATGMQLQPPEPGRIEKIKDILKATGENPAMTKESAKSAVKKFLDKMEVAAFSGDAAFNNDIRRNLQKDFADNPEVLGMLLEASQSQAVHADALATRFIVDGGIAFDPDTKKWVSIKRDDNFIVLAKKIEKVAEKYGLSKEQAEQVAHTYFVAKRFKDLLKKQNARDVEIDRLQAELETENDNIKQYKKDGDFEKLRTSERAKNDIKSDIAKLEKARVLISEDQRAMIDPGMSLAKNMPELEDISDTWQGIRANAIKAMIDGNLWSREYAESMLDNAAYVPFYREEQLDEAGGPQEFIKGFQVKAAEFRLKGSNAAVNDVFDNMVRWTQYAINRSIRNHKALQMVDLGTELKVGDRKMAEKVEKMDPKKNTIRVFRDGVQEIYSMADPLYVDAFSAISNVTIPSLKFFTWFSNMLRQSVVLYPLFSLAQVPQDAYSAMFTSGLKTRYALRIPVLAVKEFIKTLAKTSATHKLLESYGTTGVRDFNATVARNDIQIAAGLKGAKGIGGKSLEFLSHIAMAADNSIRQAVYEASMQQGLSKGEAIEKAFDIINFRRRGTSKLVNLAGQTVPFFYAYMSVQRTAFKTLTGVGISPQERKEALMTLATTSGAVMALSLFYTMMNGGDEEYEKTPTAIRDRTLNVPGTGGLRIPLRPDLFLLPKVITEHLYHLITDTGFSDGAKFRKSVADGIANAVLSPQPIPQAVKPALEVAINYDFFQGRPLIGQFEKKKEAERQFNDNTSEFSKMLGEFGVSPIAADHMIRGMFGSAGGLFLYMTNFMANSDPDVPRPEVSFRDALSSLPGTSGFVTKASENALKTDFYALRDEVEKVKNTYNDIKLRSPQELEQFLSDEKNIARLGLAKSTEKIGGELSKIRRAIGQITNAPDDLYSASEKKDAIKELRDVEKEMLKAVDLPGLRKMAQM
jgi:hypothetical protein